MEPIDPTVLSQMLMAIAQQDPRSIELMRAYSPEDVTRMITGSFQPQPGMSADLGTALTSDLAGQAGMDPSQAGSLYPPLTPPPGQPMMGPPGGPPGPPRPPVTPPPGQQRFPQVRMPEATRPIFSGGVAGSQKAPEPAMKTGLSPAMALLQAIMGPRASGGGRAQGGQAMPSLGELLGGRS